MGTCFPWLCVTQRVFILRYSSYWRVPWLIIYAENHSPEFFNQNVYPCGWAALKHHRNVTYKLQQVSIRFILPLLRDKVSTFNMQAHLIQLNMKWTAVLNPGQTLVDVSHQPVYAFTKELQFRHPEMFSHLQTTLYWAVFNDNL